MDRRFLQAAIAVPKDLLVVSLDDDWPRRSSPLRTLCRTKQSGAQHLWIIAIPNGFLAES
jgi:hypothetical protein